MKKLAVLLTAFALLTLSACQSTAAVNHDTRSAGMSEDSPVLSEAPDTAVTAVPSTETPPPEIGASGGDIVEIKEKLFIAQTNDIYYNAKDYFGKTIKYEGIFNIYVNPQTGKTYYSVVRYGPGCCGFDGLAGFEVVWDGTYPEHNDWVEVVGVLEEYDTIYLRLVLSELTVLTERGQEIVYQ